MYNALDNRRFPHTKVTYHQNLEKILNPATFKLLLSGPHLQSKRWIKLQHFHNNQGNFYFP